MHKIGILFLWTWGAFHLLRNSENSSWDVNGTHVFRAFTGKFRAIIGILKKVALAVFPLENFRWKSMFHLLRVSQGILASSRLFTQGDICATILNFGDERINEWNLRQMERPFHGLFRKFLVNGKRPRHSLMRTTGTWFLPNQEILVESQPR